MSRGLFGAASVVAFAGLVVAANWLTAQCGLVPVGPGQHTTIHSGGIAVVGISAKFRKDTEVYDGLTAIEHLLISKPHDRRLIVALVQTKRITTELATGTVTPTIELVHVEALDGDARDMGQKLLDEQFRERTGGTVELPQDQLPLDDGPVAERPKDEWLDPAATETKPAKRGARTTPPPAEFSSPDQPDTSDEG